MVSSFKYNKPESYFTRSEVSPEEIWLRIRREIDAKKQQQQKWYPHRNKRYTE